MAAPSPSANPLRVRSNGRAADSGVSLRGVVALIASKQATVIGEIAASEAPAITTSALPSATSSAACAITSMPDVQPVDTIPTGPSAPVRQAISAAIDDGRK